MKTIVKTLLASTLLLGAVTATAGVANAAVGVGFNIGDVSVGFNDGYWDNHHRFHRWARHEDMEAWRHAHADAYHDWRHDDKHHHM
jgi:hypothetical protein